LPDEIEPGNNQQVSRIQRVASAEGDAATHGQRAQGCKKQHRKQQAAVINNGRQPARQTAGGMMFDVRHAREKYADDEYCRHGAVAALSASTPGLS